MGYIRWRHSGLTPFILPTPEGLSPFRRHSPWVRLKLAARLVRHQAEEVLFEWARPVEVRLVAFDLYLHVEDRLDVATARMLDASASSSR